MKRPANPLALAVLTLVWEKPMHPYEMSSTLRERHNEDSIKLNFGSLYSVVQSLQKKGLIEARETIRDGRRPERTIYGITDPGIATLETWLSEMVSVPTPQFIDFEAALSLIGALPPDEALELLRQRIKALQVQLHTYKATRAAIPEAFPELFMIEGDYQAALLEAELAFVQGLVKRVESEDLGGLSVWRRLHELRSSGVPPEEVQRTVAAEFEKELTWDLSG